MWSPLPLSRNIYESLPVDECVNDERENELPPPQMPHIQSQRNKHKLKQSTQRRPSVVFSKYPENEQYVSKTTGSVERKMKRRPLVAIIGDSIIKHVTSFDIRKTSKAASYMVWPCLGAKIKNIKNYVDDFLEDHTPSVIILHVGTNNISAGDQPSEIISQMKELVEQIQHRGITVFISLLTSRSDEHGHAVAEVNRSLIEMCYKLDIGYLGHENINASHLNQSGVHIR